MSAKFGEWLPMKTCPRDGKEVLFWHRGDDHTKRGCKVGLMVKWGIHWRPKIGPVVYSTTFDRFEGWMPLPEPPQ